MKRTWWSIRGQTTREIGVAPNFQATHRQKSANHATASQLSENCDAQAKYKDTAPEIVWCAQLPALFVVVTKECWDVQTIHGTGWEEGVVRWWSKGITHMEHVKNARVC